MKKRIIHVLNSKAYAGAENVVINIINNMGDSSEYEFIYVSLRGPISKILEENNINYVLVDKINIITMKSIIKKYNPAVIHAHDFTASIISSVACKDIPIISHLHNNRPWIKQKNIRSYMYYLSSFKYKFILGVSGSIFKEYVFGKKIESKSKVIGNPIDISKIISKSIEFDYNYKSYDFLYLGRLSEAKNPKRFISLVYQLKKLKPDLRVAMIGSGELKYDCLQLIRELNIENVIDMLGFLKNPYPILKNSKALCMTSEWEGYGMAAIEALTLGIPVLATPVGGLNDIINEKCGKLCSNDTEFINEMILFMNNEELRKSKSENAKKRAKELNNIDTYIRELELIYNSLI